MGFLDKVMFWKKGDDFSDLGLGKDFDFDKEFGKSEQKQSSPPAQPHNQDAMNAFGQNAAMDFGKQSYGQNDFAQQDYSQQSDLGQQSQNRQGLGQHNPDSQGFSQDIGHNDETSQPSFAQQRFQQQPQSYQRYPHEASSGNIDLQLVSAKLDAIKAYLDTINQRISNIEQLARGEDNKRW